MLDERNAQRSDPLDIDAALALLVPKRVMDENALTIAELAAKINMGVCAAQRRVDVGIEDGTWEQVFKVASSGRVAKAYRPKK
jgi:hypothetical protein